jgi:hypothetical protein
MNADWLQRRKQMGQLEKNLLTRKLKEIKNKGAIYESDGDDNISMSSAGYDSDNFSPQK